MTILYFIIALGLLVFIHEFGHFLAAKYQGIGVEKFSLGFGPKLFGFKKGETHYRISALPLGGYVKLVGENPEESQAGNPRDYSTRPVGHRFGVVFAGPLMNLLLAFLFMPLVFLLGRSEPAYWQEAPVVAQIRKDSAAEKGGLKAGDKILSVDGKEVLTWKGLMNEVVLKGGEEVLLVMEREGAKTEQRVTIGEEGEGRPGLLGVEPYFFIGNEAVVDEVLANGPAAEAGLQPGDEITKIDATPIVGWLEMADAIHHSQGKPVPLTVRRGGREISFSVKPRFEEGLKRWVIGIQKDVEKSAGERVVIQYPFFKAVQLGMEENLKLAGLTFSVVYRLVTLQLSYKTLGGPIRIAQASAEAAKTGFSNFLYFLAFLSLQLGVLNLLPIPVLDGGHLLFMGIEAAIRRPLSMKVRLVLEQAGFLLLVTLMVLVTLHDIDSIWGFGRMLAWFKGVF